MTELAIKLPLLIRSQAMVIIVPEIIKNRGFNLKIRASKKPAIVNKRFNKSKSRKKYRGRVNVNRPINSIDQGRHRMKPRIGSRKGLSGERSESQQASSNRSRIKPMNKDKIIG